MLIPYFTLATGLIFAIIGVCNMQFQKAKDEAIENWWKNVGQRVAVPEGVGVVP